MHNSRPDTFFLILFSLLAMHNIKTNGHKKSPLGKIRAENRFKATFVADCYANPPYSVVKNRQESGIQIMDRFGADQGMIVP
jgi:hypothetical protein